MLILIMGDKENVIASNPPLLLPLIAGGMAGLTVDVTFFPLDTIKTRLQSKNGFWRTGGFRSIYSGILPAIAGSIPSAATFFCTYELVKHTLNPHIQYTPFIHMIAAALGETTCCIVRVPFEVIKQRAQANRHLKAREILYHTVKTEGTIGLYRGYVSTITREIPFSFIQYPIWEYLKGKWGEFQGESIDPWQGAVCGAVAGCIAAGTTTPLDVVKTRVMLAQKDNEDVLLSIPRLLISIGRNEGMRGLFAGFVPRITWISLGGFVFLGAYEKTTHLINTYM